MKQKYFIQPEAPRGLNKLRVVIMHLSMACPTIPLPRKTKGYQGVFTEEAGPRVGHLTFRVH